MTGTWFDINSALILAFAGYASTNIDNLMLMGAMAATHTQRRKVIAGYLIAGIAVLVISLAFIGLSKVISPHALGYLGVIPLALGLRLLLAKAPADPGQAQALPGVGAISGALLANSTDTIAVFGPLFAESAPPAAAALALGFVLCALLWMVLIVCLASRLRNTEPGLGLLSRLPGAIMVVIGCYILTDTATDLV